MKHFFTAILLCIASITYADTYNYKDMEPLKLEVPEMKAELGTVNNEEFDRSALSLTAPDPKMDFAFFKSRTNPNTKAYKFMDDMTFVGVPLFIAGIIAKSEKNAFKQQTRHSLVTKFKTGIDDYTQFFGPAAVVGLKLAGVEGRSDWPRLLASAGMGYGIMALFVNTIKHTAKEMRPDGSTANSWPSGHTATAFVGATLLHKEYGLTRSPWYSVAGYGVATATGVMRVLNNRHWISDVLSGAGLGILSGELGYAICDLFFKGKGLLRNDIPGMANVIEHPSFFSISMGIGFGTRDFDFEMKKWGWSDDLHMKFRASTAVAAEGAYFFNPYIGVGGRLRVKSTPINGWDKVVDFGWEDMDAAFESLDTDEQEVLGKNIDNIDFVIESDHLTEFSGDLGVYFNLPLSDRFALGSKLLVGRSIMQELALDAKIAGQHYYKENDSWDNPTGDAFEHSWDYFTITGSNSNKFGTGISLTYAYKQNFSWKVFLDYDYTRKTYTMDYNVGGMYEALYPEDYKNLSDAERKEFKEGTSASQSIKKNMHSFVLGASFAINF
ncbi:MAG: phosphatase PAP2 family protein [Prevotella sp.]|nr:phosphatase PAP2 family protein [Prevotella sp.]